MSTAASASRWKIIVAFGLVYVFWGSTYLGIGIAVEHIPPAVMCAARFLVAGTVMLAYCALTGRRIRFSARQLSHLAAVGILLLLGGNLTLSYAERIVPTGLSALLVSVTPLWFLALDTLLLGDHHISRRGKIGLAIGIAGVVVLIWPDLRHNNALGHRELWWSLGLQLGSFSWALGSVLSKKWQTAATDPFGAIAWQMTFAGMANLIFALLVEKPSNIAWTVPGVAAILYLVVCGPGSATPPTSGCCSTFRPRRFPPTPTSIPRSRCFWDGWFCTSASTAISRWGARSSWHRSCW